MESYIYKILNNENGKFYIGSTNNFERRLFEHISKLNKNKHCNYNLQEDWNEYGEDAFEFILLETVSKHIQYKREQEYLNELKDNPLKYNIVQDIEGIEYFEEKEKVCIVCNNNFNTKFRKYNCCSKDCLDYYFEIIGWYSPDNAWRRSEYWLKDNYDDWDVEDFIAAWWDDAMEK